MNKTRGPVGLTVRHDAPLTVGMRCGMLTIIGLPFMLARKRSQSELFVVCQCDCGKSAAFRGHSLSHNVISSCGCSKPCRHGESKTRLHEIWCHMKSRCANPNSQAWSYYGGRGIRVCEEWAESYEAFREWSLANGYQPKLEIDRKDVNGNYEPDNCRWATRIQQMANIRKRSCETTSKYKGVSRNAGAAKWRVQIQSKNRHMHVGMYGTELEAAKAYDAAATRIHGEYAVLNFPRKEGASF